MKLTNLSKTESWQSATGHHFGSARWSISAQDINKSPFSNGGIRQKPLDVRGFWPSFTSEWEWARTSLQPERLLYYMIESKEREPLTYFYQYIHKNDIKSSHSVGARHVNNNFGQVGWRACFPGRYTKKELYFIMKFDQVWSINLITRRVSIDLESCAVVWDECESESPRSTIGAPVPSEAFIVTETRFQFELRLPDAKELEWCAKTLSLRNFFNP